MNTGNRSELEKEVEDVKLLVESLEYQKDDPSQQQQALSALGEILSHNKRAQDYFCSSNGVEYVLSLCKSMKNPTVLHSALYTLAMAAEGNDFSQRVLTKKSVFNMLRCNLQAKNTKAAATSAFLVMTISAENCEGQNLARETKCLHTLCDLYKSCLPIHQLSTSTGDDSSEKWFNNIEENCLQLWSAVVVALHSLLQNPQNVQNQQLCCRLLPAIVNILHLATKQQNILLSTTTVMAAIVSENADCQSKVRLLGGLRALINLLRQHVDLKEPVDKDIVFIEHIVNTLGSVIAGHAVCKDSAADLGLVTLLVKCVELSQAPHVDDAVAQHFRTKCILALSICVDQCERNQQQLRDRGGVDVLIELLTQEQSEELRRVVIFILHYITGKSKVAGGERPRNRDTEEVGEQSSFESTTENYFSQVTVSPTRDAATQTFYQDTLSVRTTAVQCATDITDGAVPTVEEIHTTSAPRKRRFVPSTKVLKPLTRSKTTQSKTTYQEPATERKPDLTLVRPSTSSSSKDIEKCEACETVLNSRNFLKTLRRCSRLCSYHRELDQFLRLVISGSKRQK